MKKFKFSSIVIAVGLLSLSACTSETPFSTEGTGIVRMNVSMNSTMTRGDISDDVLQKLQDECVVYISDKEGLLHKWVGVSNIPSQLALKYDNYVAEAWSGDSVSASFDSKFYKGLTKFNVSESTPNQSVEITCRIANVIVSVNTETIDASIMKSVEVNVANTADNLDFTGETLPVKGYFMMPDNDSELKYKAKVTGYDGNVIEKDGTIENVIPGHHYRLNFQTDLSESTTGGAFFDIIIEDYTEEEAEHIIYGKPAFSWANSTIPVGGQIIHTSEDDGFVTEYLRVAAYNGGFKSLILETGNMSSYFGSNQKYDLVEVADDANGQYLTKLKEYGVEVVKCDKPNDEGLYVWQIIFNKELFANLAKSDTEYVMTLTATDLSGKSNSMKIRVANTEAAIRYEDPIVIKFKEFESDLTAVNAVSATIPVTIVDGSKAMALLYREENSGTWNNKAIESTRANEETVVSLTGLKENTTYEYKVVAGTEQDGKYEFESDTYKFQTESKYIIPNGDMENWFKDGSNWEPGSDSSHSFWDSGNHGASSFGYTLCEGTTDFARSGNCAKLSSVKAIIQFAAGNLFVGKFVKAHTSSPLGAEVDFGQKYNGSHPKSLKFYAKYIPAKVDTYKSDLADDFIKGELDHGQVFVALATSVYHVNTHEYRYFDPTDPSILAYGEVTWKEAFGNEDSLKEVIIDLDYKDSAKTNQATTLIIVASASKYGDYFAGGVGSVMYLDDFELVY